VGDAGPDWLQRSGNGWGIEISKLCAAAAKLLADAERRLAEIDRLVHVPTSPGTGAYTHFMRDFDRIRELTRPWHEASL